MTVDEDVRRLNFTVRITGGLYVAVAAIYGVGAFMLEDALSTGSGADTADGYHLGLLFQLAAAWGTLALAFGLYVTLRSAGKDLAQFALISRAVEATLFGAASVIAFQAADLMREPELIPGLTDVDRGALVTLLLQLKGNAETVAITFYGFGSTAFFWLFLKSRLIPKPLSVLGIVGTMLIFIWSVSELLLPLETEWTGYFFWGPISLIELAVGFWLICFGANYRHKGA